MTKNTSSSESSSIHLYVVQLHIWLLMNVVEYLCIDCWIQFHSLLVDNLLDARLIHSI